MRILLLLIALPVWAQTHIQDTTYFSFGNPSARSSCQLVITAPTTVSSNNTYWGSSINYTVNNGVFDLWAVPSSASYSVVGACNQYSQGQTTSTPVNVCWIVPVSDSPVKVAALLSACTGNNIGGGGSGGGGTGSVTQVTLLGTANQLMLSGTCNITSSGTCTFSIPIPFNVPGTLNIGAGNTPSFIHVYGLGGTQDSVLSGGLNGNGNFYLPSQDGETYPFAPPNCTATALNPFCSSMQLGLAASIWTGSAAANRYAAWDIEPSGTNAPLAVLNVFSQSQAIAVDMTGNVTIPGAFTLSGIPTSCSGLPTGTLWNSSGIVHVCP